MRRFRRTEAGVRFAVAAAVAAAVLVPAGRAQQPSAAGEWRSYSSDLASTKYSALDQIDATNVKNLRIVWRRPAIDPEIKQKFPKVGGTNYFRATPLMIGGRLYVQNGLGFAQALDAATGNVLWTQEPLTNDLQGLVGAQPARGVGYWRDAAPASGAGGAGAAAAAEGGGDRILTIRRNYLFALSAN